LELEALFGNRRWPGLQAAIRGWIAGVMGSRKGAFPELGLPRIGLRYGPNSRIGGQTRYVQPGDPLRRDGRGQRLYSNPTNPKAQRFCAGRTTPARPRDLFFFTLRIKSLPCAPGPFEEFDQQTLIFGFAAGLCLPAPSPAGQEGGNGRTGIRPRDFLVFFFRHGGPGVARGMKIR